MSGEVRGVIERFVTVWCPDWPVVAAGCPPDRPAAVLAAHRIVARTPAAAAEGVVVGQRRRQAQSRCPQVELVEHDPARDAREFESVVQAVIEIAPRVDVVEPGWISLAARGPSRYFGGDRAVADHLATVVRRVLERPVADTGAGDGVGDGVSDGEGAGAGDGGVGRGGARVGAPGVGASASPGVGAGASVGVGVADGRFASAVAARLAVRGGAPIVIEPGGSPAFCASLPVGWLQTLGEAEPELVDLLVRLGVRRLGELAELAERDVLGRFGQPGVHAWRLAAGADERPASTDDPSPERRVTRSFDDPVAHAEAVVFVAKQLADELAGRLAADGRVCTRLVVHFETEHGERSERSWYRSSGLSATAMVERVRWQLDAWVRLPAGSEGRITAGVALVRLIPDEVVADRGEQLGLWGGWSDDDRRAGRAIARLTTLTSERAVTVPVWQGGRLPAERYRWVPATTVELDGRGGAPERAETMSRRDPSSRDLPGAGLPAGGPSGEPWPGSLPAPSPATVYDPPVPIEVIDHAGRPVAVSGRGVVSAAPAVIRRRRDDASAAAEGPSGGEPAAGWMVSGSGGEPAAGWMVSGSGGEPAAGWVVNGSGRVSAWAGPWPVDQRWWEPARHRRLARFQLIVDEPVPDGSTAGPGTAPAAGPGAAPAAGSGTAPETGNAALLVAAEHRRWWLIAAYD